MSTKSFKLDTNEWTELSTKTDLVNDKVYAIQPSKYTLYFYQGENAPTKDDYGIGVDPSGYIKFRNMDNLPCYVRVLYPEITVITISDVL